jgi:hypothetical protein
MRYHPQLLITPLTRRRLLQGTLGGVAGLAAAQDRCGPATRTAWADDLGGPGDYCAHLV